VASKLAISALDRRLVTARIAHRAAQLVGDEHLGHAAEKLERSNVHRDPLGQLLAQRRFGIGVVAGAEHGDEQLDVTLLARGLVGDRRPLAGEVDEELLAALVVLAHPQAPPLQPGPVALAERGVAQAGGVLGQVVQVQQLQRRADLP